MPALAADIARAQRRATIIEAENPAMKAVYAQARDGRTAPARGYFDSAADAQAAVDARLDLIGTVRRRFTVTVAGLVFPDLSTGVPVWTLIDAENDATGPFLVARMEHDTENETTVMELYG